MSGQGETAYATASAGAGTPASGAEKKPGKLTHLEFIHLKALLLLSWFESLFNYEISPLKKKFDYFVKEIIKPAYERIRKVFYNLLEYIDNMVESVVIFVQKLWWWLNRVLMYPVTAQFLLLTAAFYLVRQYNLAVLHLRLKYHDWAKHIPLIPIKKISAILKIPINWILAILTDRVEEFRATRKKFEDDIKKVVDDIEEIKRRKKEEVR